MKKHFYLVAMMTLFMVYSASALTSVTQNYSISEDVVSVETGGSNVVYMDCEEDPTMCFVVCIGGGPTPCTISSALDACIGCLESKVVPFLEGEGQEMFDYANDQMSHGELKGEFTKNLLKQDGKKIYRTVKWEVDSKGNRKSDLSITIVTE